ncbi:MAG: NUDIX hydrolase [Planctomycetes bacterium]|nr:NUDIX hydrolase [Planctomycetota bacterium]
MSRAESIEPRGPGRRLFRGRVFSVERTPVRLASGRRSERDLVTHPGSAAMVPVLPDGRVCLIRQYRFSVRRTCIEIPAGTLEPGEAPLACARRELEEETGFRAKRFRRLAVFYPAIGFCTEKMWLYLAEGLSPGRVDRDPDEIIDTIRVDWSTALRWARTGRILDAKSILGLLLAAKRLEVT